MAKGKLRGFLKDRLLKELEDYSAWVETAKNTARAANRTL
jgi:hypothetical protein